MLNLFSSMDYCFSKLVILKALVWIFGTCFFIFFFTKYFFLPGRIGQKLKNFMLRFCSLTGFITENFSFSFFHIISWGTFLIIYRKIWGIVPYVFGITSQMVFVFSIAFVIWSAIFFYKIFYAVFRFFSHTVPEERPLLLGSFISIIELISNLMRPLTLSLRLGIKITTGHIILTLISTGSLRFLLKFSIVKFLICSLILGFYLTFELLVCVVQGVVFSLLLKEYIRELPL